MFIFLSIMFHSVNEDWYWNTCIQWVVFQLKDKRTRYSCVLLQIKITTLHRGFYNKQIEATPAVRVSNTIGRFIKIYNPDQS